MLSLEERNKVADFIMANESGDKELSHAYKEKIEEIVKSLTLDDLFEIDNIIMSKLGAKK